MMTTLLSSDLLTSITSFPVYSISRGNTQNRFPIHIRFNLGPGLLRCLPLSAAVPVHRFPSSSFHPSSLNQFTLSALLTLFSEIYILKIISLSLTPHCVQRIGNHFSLLVQQGPTRNINPTPSNDPITLFAGILIMTLATKQNGVNENANYV